MMDGCATLSSAQERLWNPKLIFHPDAPLLLWGKCGGCIPPAPTQQTWTAVHHAGPGSGLSTDELERQTALQVQLGGLGQKAGGLPTSTTPWWTFGWEFEFWSKYIEIYLQERNGFSCPFLLRHRDMKEPFLFLWVGSFFTQMLGWSNPLPCQQDFQRSKKHHAVRFFSLQSKHWPNFVESLTTFSSQRVLALRLSWPTMQTATKRGGGSCP